MKLRTKLISSFTAIVILLLLIGIASQYFNDRIKDRVIDESQNAVKELQISGTLEAYLNQSFINTQYYLDERYHSTIVNYEDSLINAENAKRNVRIALQGLNLNLQKIDRFINKNQSNHLLSSNNHQKITNTEDRLKNRIASYNSLIKRLLHFKEENFSDAKNMLNVTVEPYYNSKLIPLVKKFRAQIRSNQKQQVAALNSQVDKYNNILLIAILFALAFALIVEYMLYRSITNPIRSVAGAADEIGSGNFSKRIEVKTNDEIGKLASSFNLMAENLNKITFSKEYVDDIIESMGDGLIVTDNQGNISKVNSATLSLLGYSEEELLCLSMKSVLTEDYNSILLSTEENSSIENFETHFKQKNGAIFPVSLSKAMIHDNTGDVQGLVFVVNDITERKKSEKMIKESLKEKKVLLSEIHHRVKNNLAVISGLLQMQRWETDQPAAQDVLQDSQMRVKSIALVHERLYQTENLSNIAFDQYVTDLIEEINKTFNQSDKHVTFDINVEPIMFSVSQAITCSLLLNELVVNIHKHAFKSQEECKVVIRLWKGDDERGHIIVKDNGIGLPEDSNDKDSLGMSLINTLVSQLNGEMKSYNDGGAVFEINFKIEEL